MFSVVGFVVSHGSDCEQIRGNRSAIINTAASAPMLDTKACCAGSNARANRIS